MADTPAEATTNAALAAKINNKDCIKFLQDIEAKLYPATEKWRNEEGMRFLTSITGDYHKQEDMRIRADFYQAVESILQDVEDLELRKIYKRELKYMFFEFETRAVTIVSEADAWFSYWERMCYTKLTYTGIWEQEFNNVQKQNSAFFLFIKFRTERPDLYKNYIDMNDKIREFQNSLDSERRSQGSINVYNKYLLPLIEKGVTWAQQ